jgi:hypothetical protein
VADFSLKAHDRLPPIKAVLSGGGADPLDLTDATTVTFIMRNKTGGAPKVNAPAVVEDALGGTVRYDWAAGDTDTAGSYQAEWQITWNDGKKQTAPTLSYHTVDVLADLDDA